jgi:PKD repeat protein
MMTVTINVPSTCHASFNYHADSLQSHLYHFISTSTASGGSINSYNWTVNGNTVSTTATLNYTFPVGPTAVCLTIGTTSGCTSTICDSVIVPDSNHCNANAAFNVSVNQATATFQATGSIGSNYFHQWKFGDNTQGWGTNVSHTYQASGTYNVWHIVTDSINNCRDSVMKTITVNVPATCRASFTYRRDSLQSRLYHFVSTSTATGGSISAYNWKVNGNTVSTASTLNYTLPVGRSSVCLTILTTAGCSSTACDSIIVADSNHCNWSASFTTTASPNNPKQLTFYPLPSQPNLIYQWKIIANGVHTYTVKNPVHTFQQAGTYNVWLRIIDSANQCMDTVVQQVTVQGSPADSCTINYTYSPVPGNPLQLTFTASSNQTITSWLWSIYGRDSSCNATYTIANPTHTFCDSGYYTVCLRIQTNTGCIRTLCRTISIDSLASGRNGIVNSYPNPVTGDNVNLRVQMQQAGAIYLTIYNTSGNIVKTVARSGGAGTNVVSIPVSSLQRGQYFVEIRYGNERKRSIFQKF